jgi:tRNA nucleotidyltransferase/poly(A) polymerase
MASSKSTEYQAACEVVRCLKAQGFIGLFAGGCVRDMLLGRPVSDYDVATNAKPKEVQRLFRRTRKVGAQFGIIIAIVDGHQIEIATFRSDGQYIDGRHPESVTFSSPEEDAKRRDFTINGLFYDPQEMALQDFIGGQDDLWRGQIRAIGNAQQRILEDHLRLLRAVRFSARFGFVVEQETREAIENHCQLILKVSPERIKEELSKILKEPTRARGLPALLDYGLLKCIDMALYVDLEGRRIETVKQFDVLPKRLDEAVSWAVLLGSEKNTERVLRQLRASNELRERTVGILRHASAYGRYRQLSLSQRKRLQRRPQRKQHFLYAWSLALSRDGDLSELVAANDDWLRYGREGDASLFADLLVSGHDLIKLGLRPGPKFKEMLSLAEDSQLEGEADKQTLIALLERQYPDAFPNQ